MKAIAAQYKEDLIIDVWSGGMILPETPKPISLTAPYLRETCKSAEAHTGIEFGESYLWHIEHPEQSDWFPDSLPPAVALAVLKTALPEKALEFASELQYALCFEGRDLTDEEAYRHILHRYELDAASFYKDLHSPVLSGKGRYDFERVKQLQVSSFPAVFLRASGHKFYRIASGYTDLESMKARLDPVLKAIKPG